MLIILSPAKTMDMTTISATDMGTTPIYKAEAEELAASMREYTVSGLEKLLKISGKLAEINYQRYQQFDQPRTPQKQAIFAYDGSVFKQIEPETFSKADLEYAQEHLRIISTLYGLVKPLDLIKAYRIAFSLKLKSLKDKDLYEYWLPKLTVPLSEDARKSGGIIVNLASLDVLGALHMDELVRRVTVITPEFQEYRNGKYQTVRTYAKMARGVMTRYIIKNRIESPDKLKEFEYNGFVYNKSISDDTHYVFTRPTKSAQK